MKNTYCNLNVVIAHGFLPAVVKIDGDDMVVNVRLGDRAILKCTAHGIPQPRTSWSKGKR